MNSFLEGRKQLFSNLEQQISSGDRTIWFHAASLGEYEQAVPVIESLGNHYKDHKIVISFFSPSGYEVKKNTALAHVVTYLPLDTPRNAKKFLDLVHPDLALFIKYEFWPNFLKELGKKEIPTYLVSGAFRKEQVFFKCYGGWMRTYLKNFEHFFVQNESSAQLLRSIGCNNVTVSGDTRFDRVAAQIQQQNELNFATEFKAGELCVVAGSTWPEDDELLVSFINSAPKKVKFIIAPHALNAENIEKLQEKLEVRSVRFSERQGRSLAGYQVLILDTIGLLTRIYSYADIAYVGGAAGSTGLHNILEPATFGLPIIIGKNYSKFPEAGMLKELGGLFSVNDKKELKAVLNRLVQEEDYRIKAGSIAAKYIDANTGATKIITDFIISNFYNE